MYCGKMVFVPSLGREKPCIRNFGHTGHSCTPDLLGEKFGEVTVIRLGSRYIKCGNKYWTWVVECRGREKEIRANRLISGDQKGSYLHHGYSGSGVGGKPRPEWATVKNHHHNIFHSSSRGHKNYKGMPFFKEWNPDCGGDLWKGAKWIIENLGERPSPNYTMDVIDHAIGFVPGNLRWASHKTQERNKQHKWLGNVSDDEFAVEAYRRGYVKRDGN